MHCAFAGFSVRTIIGWISVISGVSAPLVGEPIAIGGRRVPETSTALPTTLSKRTLSLAEINPVTRRSSSTLPPDGWST